MSKKNKKHFDIVCILDKSGSMYPLVQDTIGGYNGFIEEQREGKGKKRVTLVLFDTSYNVVYARRKIRDVKPLKYPVYQAGGATALLDAIGATVTSLERGYSTDGEPDETVVLIITDGQENSSKEYNSDQIKEMVEKKREEGWTFFFLGANIDTFSVAADLGLDVNTTADYTASSAGTAAVYETVSKAISSRLAGYDLDADWRDGLEVSD